MTDIVFRECPKCYGYGVLDNGVNCKECGGSGTGGLRSSNGCIGSGEIMFDRQTMRRIRISDLKRSSE